MGLRPRSLESRIYLLIGDFEKIERILVGSHLHFPIYTFRQYEGVVNNLRSFFLLLLRYRHRMISNQLEFSVHQSVGSHKVIQSGTWTSVHHGEAADHAR